MPPRVLVTVRRDEDVDGRDLELPASIPASELRQLIGRGLDWPAGTADTSIRVEPGGRVLGERESLGEAGVRDGAWLVFGAQSEPLIGGPVSPFRLAQSNADQSGGQGPRVMRSRPGYVEPNRLVVLGICGAVIIGAVAGLVLLTRSTLGELREAEVVVVTAAPVVPTQIVAAKAVVVPTAAPTLVPTVQPTPRVVVSPPTAAPTLQSTVPPTAAPTALPTVPPTPVPSASPWPAAQAQLDPLWGRDWPAAIGVLQGFLEQAPGDATATDKLYAALVEYGRDLASNGDPDQARAAFQGAATLRPERSEALDELQALAPRPTPIPPSVVAAPTAVPAPPPVRVAPPANQPPAPPVKQPVTRDGFASPNP